jgi:hypothetical protein
MRKFRFIGDPEDYNNDVIFGEIYLENYQPKKWPLSVIGYFGLPEWEEVIEKPKPLHKDTDLGYFAGVAMQSILLSDSYKSASARTKVENAIFLAKELIKQLDQEAK